MHFAVLQILDVNHCRKSFFCGTAEDYLRSPEGRRFREEGTV